MEYQFVNDEAKTTGMMNRLAQLEQEHYTAVLYMEEARVINSQADIEALQNKLASLEVRIKYYQEKLENDSTNED